VIRIGVNGHGRLWVSAIVRDFQRGGRR